MKKRMLMAALMLVLCVHVSGQFTYGTTGLLNMPTGDMQKDKTVGRRVSEQACHSIPMEL